MPSREESEIRDSVRRELDSTEYQQWVGSLYLRESRAPIHDRLYDDGMRKKEVQREYVGIQKSEEPPCLSPPPPQEDSVRPALADATNKPAQRSVKKEAALDSVAKDGTPAAPCVWDRLQKAEIRNFKPAARSEPPPSFHPRVLGTEKFGLKRKGSVFDRLYGIAKARAPPPPPPPDDAAADAAIQVSVLSDGDEFPPATHPPAARTPGDAYPSPHSSASDGIRVVTDGTAAGRSDEGGVVSGVGRSQSLGCFDDEQQRGDPFSLSPPSEVPSRRSGSPQRSTRNDLPVLPGATARVYEAAARGYLPALQRGSQRDLAAPDEQGRTPLMHAVSHGRVEAAACIASRIGAGVNARDPATRQTALHIAAARRLPEAAGVLISSPHIQPFLKDANGFTPLHLASGANDYGLPQAARLVCSGRPPLGRTARGLVLLKDAVVKDEAGRDLDTAALSPVGLEVVVDSIVEEARDAGKKGPPGSGLIDESKVWRVDDGVAPAAGDAAGLQVLRMLLALDGAGAAVLECDMRGRTAMHHAVRTGWAAKLAALRTVVPCYDACPADSAGRSLAHYCCVHGSVDSLRLLFAERRDANAEDAAGFTPHQHALANGRRRCADFLLSATAADGTAPFPTGPRKKQAAAPSGRSLWAEYLLPLLLCAVACGLFIAPVAAPALSCAPGVPPCLALADAHRLKGRLAAPRLFASAAAGFAALQLLGVAGAFAAVSGAPAAASGGLYLASCGAALAAYFAGNARDPCFYAARRHGRAAGPRWLAAVAAAASVRAALVVLAVAGAVDGYWMGDLARILVNSRPDGVACALLLGLAAVTVSGYLCYAGMRRRAVPAWFLGDPRVGAVLLVTTHALLPAVMCNLLGADRGTAVFQRTVEYPVLRGAGLVVLLSVVSGAVAYGSRVTRMAPVLHAADAAQGLAVAVSLALCPPAAAAAVATVTCVPAAWLWWRFAPDPAWRTAFAVAQLAVGVLSASLLVVALGGPGAAST
eukprot:gene8345-12865_t